MDKLGIVKNVEAFGDTYDLVVYKGEYQNGGIAIDIRCLENGYEEPYAVLSVNLPEVSHALDKNEFFVKLWSENNHLHKPMIESGLFIDTGRFAVGGYVDAPIWKLA